MLAEMLEYILKIEAGNALVIGAVCSIAYTLRGGFSAVIKTDFIQFILMFLGFGYMAIYLFVKYKGFEALSSLDSYMLTFPGKLEWTYILTWGFIALTTFVDPSFYQRIYSSENRNIAKKGIYISIGFWFLFDILSITVGLYSAAILPEIQFSPYIDIAEYILPPVIKGVFIVSILAPNLLHISSILMLKYPF